MRLSDGNTRRGLYWFIHLTSFSRCGHRTALRPEEPTPGEGAGGAAPRAPESRPARAHDLARRGERTAPAPAPGRAAGGPGRVPAPGPSVTGFGPGQGGH